ncbi:MAG: RNA methyltransferase [Leptospirales bacterium]|nr:RNA methyltransferase [Leptospirales bacterium]
MLILFRTLEGPPPPSVTLNESELRHLRARRLKPGATLGLGDGAGRRWSGQLSADLQRLELDLSSELRCAEPELRLYCAPPERNRQDWLLPKAVELGVHSLTWLQTARSEHRPLDAARAERIMREAAAQSERFILPQAPASVALDELYAPQSASSLRFVLSPGAETTLLEELCALRQRAPALCAPYRAPLQLAIGPEGGWEQTELERLQQAGWRCAALGRSILRVESAALAALAIAQSACY